MCCRRSSSFLPRKTSWCRSLWPTVRRSSICMKRWAAAGRNRRKTAHRSRKNRLGFQGESPWGVSFLPSSPHGEVGSFDIFSEQVRGEQRTGEPVGVQFFLERAQNLRGAGEGNGTGLILGHGFRDEF